MNKQNIIRITLYVSVLVFNPIVADAMDITTAIQVDRRATVTENIASALYEKGLDEKAAIVRAEELVNGDEKIFAQMLNNLLNGCNEINKEDLLDHLSYAALHRQNIKLDSYDHLIGIYTKVNRMHPDEKVREKLSSVARKNSFIAV